MTQSAPVKILLSAFVTHLDAVIIIITNLELRLVVTDGLQDGVSDMAGGQHEVVGEAAQPIRA